MTSEPGDSGAVEPRVRFYLENRDDIETWHQIRREATSVCTDLLASFRVDLEEQLTRPGLTTHALDIGRLSSIAVAPAGVTLASDNTPIASIAIEWARDVIFDDPSAAPSVGLRVATSEPRSKDINKALRAATRSERRRRGWNRSPSWPEWERVVAQSRWWDEPGRYFEHLQSRFQEHIDLFLPDLERALAEASG